MIKQLVIGKILSLDCKTMYYYNTYANFYNLFRNIPLYIVLRRQSTRSYGEPLRLPCQLYACSTISKVVSLESGGSDGKLLFHTLDLSRYKDSSLVVPRISIPYTPHHTTIILSASSLLFNFNYALQLYSFEFTF